MNLPHLSPSYLLCLALLHFLWQGAAVVALTLLLAAVARRISSHAQYVVQLTGLCLLPAVFAGTLVWLWVQQPVVIDPPVEPTVVIATEAEPAVIYRLSQQGEGKVLTPPVDAAHDFWSTLARYSPLLAIAYLFGVALLGLRLIVGLCGARRLMREAAPLEDEDLLAFLGKLCQRLGLRTIPVVAYCRDVAVPTVIGVVRPTILLPLAAAAGMTPGEIETILTHELVHIRRYDHLLVLVQRVLEVVFFFHPAVWLLSRRISDVREHCCDDRVIALGTQRHLYVESLLRAAELSLGVEQLKPSSLALALSAVDNPSRLRQRILRLVGQPAPVPMRLRPSSMVLLGFVLAAVIAAPLAMQSFAQTADEQVPIAEPEGIASQVNERVSQLKIVDPQQNPSEQSQVPDHARAEQFLSKVIKDLREEEQLAKDRQSLAEAINAHLTVHMRGSTRCEDCHRDPHQDTKQTFLFGASEGEPHDLRDTSDATVTFRGLFGEQHKVKVRGSTIGSVWGTDLYTDDSQIGAAAVHAGLVKPEEEAVLVLTVVKSPLRHVGSTRNGITSRDYGTWESSFMLHKPAVNVEAAQGRLYDVKGALHFLDRATEQQLISKADLSNTKFYLGKADLRAAPASAVPFRGKLGRQFDVEIVGRTDGSIWGTDVYTDDSSIATAAVHTGLVKPGEPAVVTLVIVESPSQHTASERNGVKSGEWGSYPSSYILLKKSPLTAKTEAWPPAPSNAMGFRGKLGRRFEIGVIGRTDGPVWGTDVYTDDSHIATAAGHAGLVKPDERATLILTMVESPDRHRGTTRNGVTSMDYGSHPSSYILQRKTVDAASGPTMPRGRRVKIRTIPGSMPDMGDDGSSMMPGGADGTNSDGGTAGNLGPTPIPLLPLGVPGRVVDGSDAGASDGTGNATVKAPDSETTDAVFLRRLFLDVTGTLPTAEEMRKFLDDTSTNKRKKLVDKLLEEPKHADHFSRRWIEIIRNRSGSISPSSDDQPNHVDATPLRGDFGTQLDVDIVGRTTGVVWGTDVYTDDSDVPTAAVHAGLVKPGERGIVTMTIVKSPDEYKGSSQNGVTSRDYGMFSSGYILQKKK